MNPRARTALAAAAGSALRGLLRLPEPVKERLAGPPVVLDGLSLDLDMRIMRRLATLIPEEGGEDPPVPTVRAELAANTRLLRGPVVPDVLVEPATIDGRLPARRYTPAGLPKGSGLLVYFHGGGWVVGDLDTHDNVCRFVAAQARVRVLSVGYRLAPESPFPAAVEDAVTAFQVAVRNAEFLGADPAKVAVGGDSAGGGLAITTALQTVRSGGPHPAFVLAIYPAVDFSRRRRSRELFGEGFFLTDIGMKWFERHYLGSWTDKTDPRVSPLLAPDLAGFPPTYLSTAGFDPLRDEGEDFAARLEDAGVAVTFSRQAGLVHGYFNMFTTSRSARAAVLEATEVLRKALA